MALSITTGPEVTTGNTNPVQLSDFDAGPNINFQGEGYLDPRYVASIGAALPLLVSIRRTRTRSSRS